MYFNHLEIGTIGYLTCDTTRRLGELAKSRIVSESEVQVLVPLDFVSSVHAIAVHFDSPEVAEGAGLAAFVVSVRFLDLDSGMRGTISSVAEEPAFILTRAAAGGGGRAAAASPSVC